MDRKQFKAAHVAYVLVEEQNDKDRGMMEYKIVPEEVCKVGREYVYTTHGREYIIKSGIEKDGYCRAKRTIFPTHEDAKAECNRKAIRLEISKYLSVIGDNCVLDLDVQDLETLYRIFFKQEWSGVLVE